MNRKITPPIPEAIVQLQRQLDQFRSTQPRRTKLPESLWQAAVELARQHGIYPVAHPLRLDYMGLKKRLGGVPIVQRGEPIGTPNLQIFGFCNRLQQFVNTLQQFWRSDCACNRLQQPPAAKTLPRQPNTW